MWRVEPLALTEEDRRELERQMPPAQTTPHRDRQRAQVVLLAPWGMVGRRVAKRGRALAPGKLRNGGFASAEISPGGDRGRRAIRSAARLWTDRPPRPDGEGHLDAP